ncbi:PIN domain-containing protein [Massilia sp. TWR1-2-2]|uniref:PIN domain-containing protein n=1 Tax=Massilia sp. TWR1-2-2 TaxID=2804584 RepID=UPI003CF3433E
MELVLLDTTIVIDFFNGIPQAADEVAKHDDIAISVITWLEVLAGVHSDPDAERQTKAQLASFTVHPLEVGAVADRTVALRSASFAPGAKKLPIPDAIIKATADVHGRILVTRNTRDFGFPDVRIPYQVQIDANGKLTVFDVKA